MPSDRVPLAMYQSRHSVLSPTLVTSAVFEFGVESLLLLWNSEMTASRAQLQTENPAIAANKIRRMGMVFG